MDFQSDNQLHNHQMIHLVAIEVYGDFQVVIVDQFIREERDVDPRG